ncbi:ASCH domain-containing protein [Vibrio vulnificus]|nr:ASCH domain-containing protein [Vibrio vulnificus]EIY8041230.1 ASCH domain-containing protein [Vibrio vulnificus]
MTSTLHLALKTEYFRDIESGCKKFEYRLYNDYWRKRLEGRDYANIRLTLGYPKRDDISRILERQYRGYEVQTITHKHFGSDPVKVFAIRVN